MQDALPYVAAGISLLTLLIVVAEKLFGGGNALANRFHVLDKETTTAIADVRKELHLRLDEYEGTCRVGFETVKNNIHAMQTGLLEFRAKIAEELHSYIRKDDYNAGLGDIKRDVQVGFRSVDERLGQMQDLIMYANPDAQASQRKGR